MDGMDVYLDRLNRYSIVRPSAQVRARISQRSGRASTRPHR